MEKYWTQLQATATTLSAKELKKHYSRILKQKFNENSSNNSPNLELTNSQSDILHKALEIVNKHKNKLICISGCAGSGKKSNCSFVLI